MSSDTKYNPQAVSPMVMQKLSLADREEIISRQQAYVPLDGTLVSAILEAERRANAHKTGTRS